MKYISIISLAATAFSCACSAPATAEQTQTPRKSVSATSGSNKKVVERDGKYYIMLEEHERLCSDCDR